MFKFPLKRHHNNNNQTSSNHYYPNTKSASSLSNEGFIFIRCAHNHLNNNPNILNSLKGSSSSSISNSQDKNHNSKNLIESPTAVVPHKNNKYVAKSTVQSSWRPQLPLPKEIQLSNENINHQYTQPPQHQLSLQQLQLQQQQDDDVDEIQIIESDMDRFHMSKKDPSFNGSQISNGSNQNSKKWSFGRFFRRGGKKEIESESSSEDDRKAGFLPVQKYPRSSSAAQSTPNKKSKSKPSGNSAGNRSNKSMGGGFDHIVVSPNSGNSSSTVTSPVGHHIDNEFFLPLEVISPTGSQEPFYQNHQPSNQTQRLHQSQQYLPHGPQAQQQQLMSKSAHSLDRRSSRSKQRPASQKNGNSPQVLVAGSSSEEELISLNSSTFSKYRSDESIHSGGQNGAGVNGGGSRKSRAARNERYYKRLSRDGEVSHGQIPIMVAQQPTQRWKTQPVPLSIYQAPASTRQSMQQPQPQVRSSTDNNQISKLRNTSSLQHMAPYVQWNQQQRQQLQQPKNLQNSVNAAKRSISYDSHIHLQNASGRMQSKPLPPPPPPRDPLRRVNVSGHIQEGSSGELRPMSYAFDQTGVPVLPTTGLSGRCVSDDKIWAQHQPQYQSIRSLNITPNNQVTAGQPQNRRFITRADRDAHPGKKSLPNGLDIHYVADATPRSRKPIHLLEPANAAFTDDIDGPLSSGVLRTTKSGLPTSPTTVNATDFWKRMEGTTQNVVTPVPAPRGRDVQRSAMEGGMKPRSVSSSRVAEMRAYPMPMYSEVYKPNKTKPSPQPRAASPHPNQGHDEVDGVVCASLRIKPAQDNSNNYVEIRNKDMPKSHSMPDHYHRRSGEIPTTPNKYEEYVNERKEQHQNAPQPPQRKLSIVPNIPQLSFPRKKPANLEEAINELEAIYKSLGLTEPEPEVVVIKKDRVPTPNDFEKFALAHADDYDDEDSPTGEPDPIRDDVAFRNIKLANLQHKTVEKQPPFGIPVGPIVPASQTDYLHVKPKQQPQQQQAEYMTKEVKSPDVIKDDLAVRALRKDPAHPRERFQYPSGGLQKKNRATRTQSANIYALIQRDAAKPSGGDIYSYLELTKSIDRSGSMSDIHKKETANDVPSTLKLLQSLKEQEREQNLVQSAKKSQVPFRHPSQGGAICQLPQKLTNCSEEKKPQQKPTPMPRKSLTPEPQHCETYKMEEALNKIAHDAQESSIKLTQELQELRKEALITNSKPKRLDSQEDKIEQELKEIEKVSQAAKKCGKMLLDTLPDSSMVTAADATEDGNKPSRKLHKEDKLIQAIDQVSEAANKVCEKILKDIVTTEPPVVVQEAIQVKQQQPHQPKSAESKKETSSALVMPMLIKKLDPIQSDKIEAIARRCMRQLSDLADNHDYDNLNNPEIAVASTCNLEDTNTKVVSPNDLSTSNLTETHKTFVTAKPKQTIEDIDQIMRECEDHARKQEMAQKAKAGAAGKVAPGSSATASSFSSSSDCLAKSSSPTASRRFSSSITSFNPYSSSDYIKSPSSDFHAPSTDRIKSCSTTSYDVQSTTSATPNITTTSNFSCSPSPPPLNLTPISNCSATLACSPTQRARSSSPSQYNSSEELAMIFGIEEKSKMNRNQKLQKHSGNKETQNSAKDLRLPEQELPLTAASPKLLCTANECCSKTNPNECCLLTLNSCVSPVSLASSSTTNINASSPQHMSSSASTSSSTSRLETIPEVSAGVVHVEDEQNQTGEYEDGEEEEGGHIKLSPNFNRIYASRVNIFVDKAQGSEDHHRAHQMTQFDSLSSLEDTSSNPDSGNVSLADFPLGSHTVSSSSSVQLSSTFTSRFEVRNNFKTEISIRTDAADSAKQSEGGSYSNSDEVVTEEEDVDFEEEGNFPRLPTEEELLESLRESQLEYESSLSAADELGFVEMKEKRVFGRREQKLFGERIHLATEEIMAEVRALQASAQYQRKSLDNESQESSSIKNESIEDKEEEEKLNTTVCEVSFSTEAINDESDPEESTMSELYTSLKNGVCEHLDVSSLKTPQRKRSIVFETPLLEMNIMEEKINYEINIKDEQSLEDVPRENVLSLQEIALNCYELEKAWQEDEPQKEHCDRTEVLSLQDLEHNCYEKTLREQEEEEVLSFKRQQALSSVQAPDHEMDNKSSTKKEPADNCEQPEQRLRLWQPASQANADELPSTSSKTASVVNILGERRPNAVNGLTLLEHIVVACALGLINTDDLFTLCIIIIGIIIVIAIALF